MIAGYPRPQPRHRPHLARRRGARNGIAPFGGMKESGIGRESSKYGIEEFLEVNASAWAASTGNPRLASRATGISGASFLSAKAEGDAAAGSAVASLVQSGVIR